MRMIHAPVTLDAPGPWTRFTITGRAVYMRVDLVRARVTARFDQAGVICDLAVVCDLSQSATTRLVVNPQQDWAQNDRVQQPLLERARVLWRRRSADQARSRLTHDAGNHRYEFWADRRTGRVELYRRPIAAEEVEIETYLGYVDQLESAVAAVHLSATETIANTVLCRVQALAGQCWCSAHSGQSPVGRQR